MFFRTKRFELAALFYKWYNCLYLCLYHPTNVDRNLYCSNRLLYRLQQRYYSCEQNIDDNYGLQNRSFCQKVLSASVQVFQIHPNFSQHDRIRFIRISSRYQIFCQHFSLPSRSCILPFNNLYN